MPLTKITSTSIADGTVVASDIADLSVTGPKIGTGAISANNFAGGGITSNVLASNLTVSVARVNEIINVVTGAIQGNYNVHVSNTSVYYFVANTTGNVTFNLIANDASATGTTGRVNDLIKVGESVSVALMLKQGSTRYRANVYVDGVLQTAYWLANSQPSYETSLNQSIDTYNFIIVKTAQTAHPGAFTVFAANTPYGMANGQGMGVAGGQ